ncbi:MAG: hypothetical protein H6R15_1476 [Proteobacteria bacterium]|nr:hypothetical protein [Pseudomonadota bacterium]
MAIFWTADLNTGITVIDQQHMRIVEFINELEATQVVKDLKKIQQVVDDCVDYTLSHFAFEESLQEEAGYQYRKPHKKVHELFTRKVSEYQQRITQGEDISEELHAMLARWLVNHIRCDDADYVSAVKANMQPEIEPLDAPKEVGWFRRIFS